MIKTVNEYELSMIKEKLFFLKALKLSKKYNLFEYDNNAEIDFKNNFIDEEDEFECSFINNIKTLLGKSFIDFYHITGGIEDDEQDEQNDYNLIIYDLDELLNCLKLYNMDNIFENSYVNFEFVSIGYYFLLDNKYIREYFNLFTISKENIDELRNILLSYITTCRSYFYNNRNQYDRIGYNGIDIGFNNEEEANMIIFCDYQVSTTSLCYALCQMIIYIKEKIKNYYIEEFRICQMYHCI